jgi:hypothetical protein
VGLLDNAFGGCTSLYEITLPDSLQTINTRSLFGCSKLSKIIIPANVTTIADAAFGECTNLTEISVAETNNKFRVLENCGLVETVKTG